MPVTALDTVTALVVIDLQNGIVGLPTADPIGTVVANARALADAFRRRDLPVVLVNVAGTASGRTERPSPVRDMPPGWTELVPELHPQSGDHTVTKRTRGAFVGTDIEAYLRDRGVTQVVLAGVATTAGVESTARHAFDLGFNVTFALDAMTDLSADAHTYAATRVFPRIGETGATADILALLDAGSM